MSKSHCAKPLYLVVALCLVASATYAGQSANAEGSQSGPADNQVYIVGQGVSQYVTASATASVSSMTTGACEGSAEAGSAQSTSLSPWNSGAIHVSGEFTGAAAVVQQTGAAGGGGGVGCSAAFNTQSLYMRMTNLNDIGVHQFARDFLARAAVESGQFGGPETASDGYNEEGENVNEAEGDFGVTLGRGLAAPPDFAGLVGPDELSG